MKKIQQFEPNLGWPIAAIMFICFGMERLIKELENIFGNFVGRKYAVATTSGTVALCIAIQGLGLKKEDEVIVPDLTFVASSNSVILAGSKVSLVDIQKDNLCLDIEKTKQNVSEKTKAIMPVDYNGRVPDLILVVIVTLGYFRLARQRLSQLVKEECL